MGRMRVLVAEDENLVALDICRSLERHGYSVEGPCATGDQAVKLTQDRRPDIVVMDIMLKGSLDGIDAAAQIRDTTGIPVLFLTAHADQQTVARAKLVEPDGYLVKPFDDAQLFAALEMILYRKQSANGGGGLNRIPSIPVSSGADFESMSKDEFLHSEEFFAKVDRYELSRFAELCTVLNLRSGDLLPSYDDDGTVPAFLVQSGRIAMVEPSAEGKELIIEFVPPGDLFGLIAAVERNSPALMARAARDSRILVIPKKSFVLLLEAHPELAVRFTEYVSNRFRALQSLARAIAYDDVFARVSLTLGVLLPRFGKTNENRSSFVLDFSRQELASLTGTTVETVVRVLKAMEREALVRLGQRNRIEIIDVERLLQTDRSPAVSGEEGA